MYLEEKVRNDILEKSYREYFVRMSRRADSASAVQMNFPQSFRCCTHIFIIPTLFIHQLLKNASTLFVGSVVECLYAVLFI